MAPRPMISYSRREESALQVYPQQNLRRDISCVFMHIQGQLLLTSAQVHVELRRRGNSELQNSRNIVVSEISDELWFTCRQKLTTTKKDSVNA